MVLESVIPGLKLTWMHWRRKFPWYVNLRKSFQTGTAKTQKPWRISYSRLQHTSLEQCQQLLVVSILAETALIMSTPLGGGYIIFAISAVRCLLSDVRRPMSGVTHGFRSFKGKVLELLSPNLVCRLIGSVACLGLLLAVVPLLLTE